MPPVELMFGRGTVAVDIDPQVEVVVVEKPPMDLLADPAAAVQQAIESPQQAAAGGAAAPVPPLREYAQGKQTACILICDITRPVPNGLNLPVLVRALLEAGVPASGITVLVATGLHRPNEGEELSELIGDEWVEQTVTCVNHFARNDEDHVHVGTTSRGTVVRLDRRFVDAEVRIATGLVEPHFMAGYSGEHSICRSIYFELCGSPAAAPALTGATDSHTRKLSTTDKLPWFRFARLRPHRALCAVPPRACRRAQGDLTRHCPRGDDHDVSLRPFYGGPKGGGRESRWVRNNWDSTAHRSCIAQHTTA
jgi:hypothetical protein